MTEQNLADRLSRAKSWLLAASNLEREKKPEEIDQHTVFIFRYIAFNSLYGRWKLEGTEKLAWKQRDRFFDNLLTLHSADQKRKGTKELILRDALAACRSHWLRLIEDEFLDKEGYWYVQEHKQGFKGKYQSQKFTALRRLNQQEYKALLHSIFSRVWVLRNQIMHGGATFGPASFGWESVKNVNPVLRILVPAFSRLMEEYPDSVTWPPIPFPRIRSEQHPKRPLGA